MSVPRSPPSKGSKRSGPPDGRRTASTGSIVRVRAKRSTRSTRRRRPSADRCTSATSSPSPTPTSSRAFSGCAARRCSIRWDGTTTACRPSGACRTTTACAAIRRCRTTRRSRRRTSRPSSRSRCRGRTSSSCATRLTGEDEKAFEQLWKYLGLSVDWSMTYATIGKRAQRVSQLAFLHLLKRGLAYQVEAPTLWDVDFRTAVAQAELEDREMPGAYHRIRFAQRAGAGGVVEIDTTRPELIPACVALVAHPDDERYKPLFGTEVVTPLFGVRVPVQRARAGRSRKGQRHRDDLHLRRHHRRHLVARAEPAGARDHSGRRHAARRSRGARRAGSRRTPSARSATTTSCAACRRPRRARRSSSSCARAAIWSASRGRSRTP